MLPKFLRHVFVRTRCSTILFLTILLFSAFLLFYGNTSINCQFKVDSPGERIETIRSYLRMRAEMNGREIAMNDDEINIKEGRRRRTGSPSTRATDRDDSSSPSSVKNDVNKQALLITLPEQSTAQNDPTRPVTSRNESLTKAKVIDSSSSNHQKIFIETQEPVPSDNREFSRPTKPPLTVTDFTANPQTGGNTLELPHSTEKAITTSSTNALTESKKKPTRFITKKWNNTTSLKTNKNKMSTAATTSSPPVTLTSLLKKSTFKTFHRYRKISQDVAVSTTKVPKEEMVDKSLFPIEGDVACEIPILDPFHESVMKYAEIYENKENCPKTPKYGKLEGAVLLVNVTNVKNVTINFMRRSRGSYPDFYLDDHPTNFLPLIRDRFLTLKPGAAGCLARKDVNTVLVTVKDENSLVFSKNSTCTFNDIFHFVYDGMILHVQSDNFVKVSGEGEIKLVNNFDDGTRGFSFSDGGSIWLEKDCLGKRNEGDDTGQVFLKKNCTEEDAIKFELLGFQDRDGFKAIPMQTDGAELIVDTEKHREHEFYLTVKPLKKDFKDLDKVLGWPVNIVMVMIDSQSASNFKRLMPKTMEVLRSHPTTFLMNSHTIVGDATAPQLSAILTGIDLGDLPEARRYRDNGKDLDDWPLIYKELHELGYVTLHTEDDPTLGAFTYALFGFNKQPTNHYARAFWMTATKREFVRDPISCLMDEFMHMYSFSYLDSLYHSYPEKAKFAFLASSYLTHNEPNNVQYADEDIASFFEYMKSKGRLNNTFLIIFGDHGSRIERYRDTLNGRLEERLPFMSITLPEWWERGHPDIIKNMKHNSEVLTSHFDIHATLRHLLSKLAPKYTNRTVGRSLFERIDPMTRTCAHAGVEEAWCPCLQYKDIHVSNETVIRYAQEVVKELNKMLSKVSTKGLCSNLTLYEVLKANRRQANDQILRYAGTDDDDRCGTCKILLEDDRASILKSSSYIIKLSVLPSKAIVEALISNYDDKITIDPFLRRTDNYYSSSSCLSKVDLSLSKFCHCKNSG